MSLGDILSSVLVDEERAADSAPAVSDKKASGDLFLKSVYKWIDAWPQQETHTTYLRASGLYDLCPREFVLNYWQPKPNKQFDWKSQFYMAVGTGVHSYLQNMILGPLGILWGKWRNSSGIEIEGFHPDPDTALLEISKQVPLTWNYIEPEFEDLQYRVLGHGDGVVSLNRISWLRDNFKLVTSDPVAAAKILQGIESTSLALLEIKTTSSRNYAMISEAKDLPPYYQMQAAAYQQMSSFDRTIFWYINRDTMENKVFPYESDGRWWKEATRKAKIIWEAIRDETFPESMMACVLPKDKRAKECSHGGPCWASIGRFNFANYVEEGKKLAELDGRTLLDLSGKTW